MKSKTSLFGVEKSMWPAPDPMRARVLEVVDHPGGLWVVDDDEVVVVLELARVQLLVAPEDLALLFGQALRIALKRVVDRLRDVPELFGALDDPPLGLEAGILHQRDEGVVDLRNTASEGRRREVHDTLPGKRFGQPLDLIHEPTRRDGRVIGERLVSGIDELEHGLGALPRDERSRQYSPGRASSGLSRNAAAILYRRAGHRTRPRPRSRE